MKLQLLTYPAVQEYLKEKKLIVFPIGSTEQHGVMGLVGTDAFIAEAVANGACERTNTIVGPTLSIGMAQHHTAFPGTLTLRPSTIISVVQDVVDSVARSGFRGVVFLNGHGGNIPAMQAAIDEVYTEYQFNSFQGASKCKLKFINFFDGDSFLSCARKFYGDADGEHVTASEVSITQHLFPEAFAGRIGMEETPRKAMDNIGFHDGEDFKSKYPDGRIGSDPSLSRPEHGKELLKAAIDDFAKALEIFETEIG